LNTDQTLTQAKFTGKHAELTDAIIAVFYEVYNELGSGFLESIYHQAMKIALMEKGMEVAIEVPVSVFFRQQKVGDFRADLVVNNLVLLELKALQSIEKIHEQQILHYLKATSLEVGLLLNFGPNPQIRRSVFDNAQKNHKAP
jgi:GxxExxY protein